MIYFYYGTDRDKIQKIARATFDALQKKRPDASFVSFDTETFTSDLIQEITSSQGLFEKKIVARLSDIFNDKNKQEIILGALKDMKATDNIIVWSEGEVNKASLEKIKKYAEKVEEFGIKQKVNKKFPGIFKMADAIANKDKKNAWIIYLEKIKKGVPSEEIHGTIFWQIKSILIAKKAKTAGESGINPFVYNKAKNYSHKWSEEELNKSITILVDIYHKAHRGEVDFGVELEKWILSI